MRLKNKKGQGSFLSGDLPSIMMIVVSIGFFLSSVYMANSQFNSSKDELNMKAALVDASSIFLKENAKIRPSDISPRSEFWSLQMAKLENTYGVQIHAKIRAFDGPSCIDACEDKNNPNCCASGDLPPDGSDILSKRFPVALRSEGSDLEVYPALVKVTVYTPLR
jgi:hypothetical protein